MKRAILTAALVLAPGLAQATAYDIDGQHTTAEFSVKHLGISNVKGHFNDIKGTVELDDKNLAASKVHVEIATASIDTGVGKRDDHLRSPDFFDASKNPKITFDSTDVKDTGNGTLDVSGNLTMHGITKPVRLSVTDLTPPMKTPWGYSRGASATTTINRKDWDLKWNKALEAGGLVVGDTVKISIEVEMAQKK